MHAGDEVVTLRIPMAFKRRRGRKEIIVPEGHGTDGRKPAPQDALVTAVARAFRWQEFLESGRYRTVTELAEDLGVDRSYVGRVLKLACLDPALVEAIARGEEPSGTSLEGLAKTSPVVWREPRAGFGAGR